jgi:hypothetical protein
MANISLLREKNTVHHDDDRNPGTRLDLGPVKDVHINRSAIERRAATLGTRRTVISPRYLVMTQRVRSSVYVRKRDSPSARSC